MPNETVSARALCPFYKYARKKEIRCEGIVSRAASSLVFVSEKLRAAHSGRYCCGDYRLCPVYRAIMSEKYDGSG